MLVSFRPPRAGANAAHPIMSVYFNFLKIFYRYILSTLNTTSFFYFWTRMKLNQAHESYT